MELQFLAYYVSSNGVVTFSTPGAVPSDVNVAIPDASIPDNSILVWGLNCTGANDGVITTRLLVLLQIVSIGLLGLLLHGTE
jgi:hypothetical protein